MFLKQNLKKVAACVKRNKSFLITAHTNLEGDALGAELSLYRLLKKMGKSVVIVNEGPVPDSYAFLPDLDKIRRFNPRLKNLKFDCFAVVDCSGLERSGEVYRLNRKDAEILNIDHHISNENFGDVNWVDPDASCACEMIYRLYKELKVPLDKDTALDLYAGILTDTGSFRYSNTSPFTHQATADLLKYKINVPGIYKKVYEDIPFGDMQLLSKILPRIKREAQGRIAWVKMPHDLLKGRKLSFDLSEHILSFCRAIRGVEVVALFKENLGVRGEVRINFRSQGKVDVNKIAKFFGGGGHKTASGATVRGSIDSVAQKVLGKIKEAIRQGLSPS